MKEPHPIRWERTYDAISKSVYDFFEKRLLNGKDSTFSEYRRQVISMISRQSISSLDITFAMWRGTRIYIIEDGIGDLLLNTSLDSISLKHFNLPFDSIFIDLPQNDFTVSYAMPSEIQTAPLSGVYVLHDPIVTLDKEVMETMIGGGDHLVGVPLKPIIFIPVSDVIKESKIKNDDCLFSFPIFFRNDLLLPQIDWRISEFMSRASLGISTENELEAMKLNMESFKGVFEWLINIVLYITMPKARVDGGKGNQGIPFKKLMNKKQRKMASSKRVYVVGRGIRISPLDTNESGDPREGTKGAKRRAHWVRGHYREVPYGPRDVENRPTRLKWILPFPRGKGKDYIKNLYQVTI